MKPRTVMLLLSASFAAAVLAILLRQRRERAERQIDAQTDRKAGELYANRKPYNRDDTVSLNNLEDLLGGENG